MTVDDDLSVADPLAAGREALSLGRWEDARTCFEVAVAEGESAEAIEAMAMAAWWLDDAPVTIESRERAYRLYRQHGDGLGAARMAIWLVWDYLAFRGEPAVANGWLQRAHRLLDDVPPEREHGWLAIREAEFAFLLENDIAGARRLARRAREIGRSVGDADLELSALALEGMALASEGEVSKGIRLLDEASAAAVAGEISELWAVGRACCYLITACERIRDFDRADQWSQRMLEYAKRWRIPHLFAVCRAHYAGVLVWRGTWDQAEVEFDMAMQELTRARPGMAFEVVVRLAELRRRQGRLDEATALFREVEFHPLAQLGLAAVALDGGDAARARELVDRFLRQLGSSNPLQRFVGLELLINALVALGEAQRAESVFRALDELVGPLGTDPLRAAALAAAGAVAGAGGDFETARLRYEDAVDLFHRSGAPFETARARIGLARALGALGRADLAITEARAALEAMQRMHAETESNNAAAVLRELDADEPLTGAAALTRREVEVLRLVAEGLSNPAIAERLVLSEHTVHRHVANILTKLHLSSRAAAATWAAQHRLV
jgi:LuxR family transcriptional regulator, maltose regulon positive regulatory protein